MRASCRRALVGIALAVGLFSEGSASAQEFYVLRPAPPYSPPWLLRGVLLANTLRLDTSGGRYEDNAGHIGTEIVSNFSAQLKIPQTGRSQEGLAVVARAAIASNSSPSNTSAVIASNPFGGAIYGLSFGPIHTAVTGGVTIPVGGGGGGSPSAATVEARRQAAATRMSMDGSLWSPNDLAVIGGIDVAYVEYGLTVQLEASFFELLRQRGEAAQPEATKTNMTSGLHVGYFLWHFFSLSGEVRYQRWLNPPFSTRTASEAIDQTSFSAGPRFHFRLGDVAFIRPGISYSRGLDKPLAASTPNFHVVQLDIPFIFR
jgi:hypothetical protein